MGLKTQPPLSDFQDVAKGGLSLRGVAFVMVLAVLESTLPSLCLSQIIQDKEAAVTVLAVSAVMAVSVVTATPLKLDPPPFPTSRLIHEPKATVTSSS